MLNRPVSLVLGLVLSIVLGVFAPTLSYAESSASDEVFQNISSKSRPGAISISWHINYEQYGQYEDYDIVVKYNTGIGAKRNKKNYEGSDWMYSDRLPLHTTKFLLDHLLDNESYEFYLALVPSGSEPVDGSEELSAVSSKQKAKTERSWGIVKFLIMAGALGLFIFGMKIMSDGLQRTAGDRLRKMLGSITSNRVKGVLTGFGSTAIVQSSSVTTVITVSLVNAGLLTLRQSAGVMMGANIGTTITAWLVLLLGFKVDISEYALVLIALGAPLMFMRMSRAKEIGNAIIGFAILFIGLQFLKHSVPELDKDSAIVRFFVDYKDIPVLSNVMFVCLGALVTIIIQSSSAAMALTLTMVSKGIIPFEVACAMVLGENIGTTITAELASLVGNVHAKRSARIHSTFNIIGVTWMLILIVPFLEGIGYLVSKLHGTPFDPLNPDLANEGIALFHTCFNLSNVVLLIWFVPQLVRIAEKTVKSRGDSDEEFKLDYITGGGNINFPDVAIMEATKEVAKFGKIASRMPKFIEALINKQDKKVRKKMFEKIAKYEEITDRVEIEIAQFLDKVSTSKLNAQNTARVRSMLSITNDLERIGDVFYQMSKTIEQKDHNRVYFLPDQRTNLLKMIELLREAFDVMNANLEMEYGKADLNKAREIEERINSLRDELRSVHLDDIEKGSYHIQAGMLYNDLFSLCEKVGDHIINVSEAAAGEI